MAGRDNKKRQFERWPLFKRFHVTVGAGTEEERALIEDVEEYVSDKFLRHSYFNNQPEKALVLTVYSIAMDYFKLKREYEREQVRIRRLMEKIKKIRESL